MPSVLTANTVPWPELPPKYAVPYRVLPDKINPAAGTAPSLLVLCGGALVAVKMCRVLKPVPSVLRANTVPVRFVPPQIAVPYRVFPDKSNVAYGKAPSLPPVKLYKFVKL